MTDNEIIKALECCASVDDGCLTDCPLYDGDDSCFSTLLKPILDLINRQQAEIERLKKQHRLNLLEQLDIAEQIKAEAIKEFAERLKEQAYLTDHKVYAVLRDDIDNLVKEMVGEE